MWVVCCNPVVLNPSCLVESLDGFLKNADALAPVQTNFFRISRWNRGNGAFLTHREHYSASRLEAQRNYTGFGGS